MDKSVNNPVNTTVPKTGPGAAQDSASVEFKGKDGYRPETVSDATRVAAPTRISTKQLLSLEPRLTDTDWEILQFIRRCRAALGRQIGRLYFTDRATARANTTATNRKMKELDGLGLVTSINRKINCRLKGYSAYIYHLTEAGERILQIHNNEPMARKRNMEPSVATLAHTLSVVECYVQTVEACRAGDMGLKEIRLEPECWRPYRHRFKECILKPDLSIVTEKQDWQDHEEPWYEMHWFIEVDLNTENIQTILEKCRRYYDYYRTDIEQRAHDDVFPLVVWIVKNEARKQSLVRHIRETFPKYPVIFAVILPDEFRSLLRDELEMEDCLCPN